MDFYDTMYCNNIPVIILHEKGLLTLHSTLIPCFKIHVKIHLCKRLPTLHFN